MIPGFFAKLLELALIVAVHPARGVDIHRFVNRLDLILVLQAIGDHIELKLAHRAHNQVRGVHQRKHLRGALLRELLQTLLKLLGLHGITQANAAKQFRRKVRDTGETEGFTVGKGVADLNRAVVVQADDITRQGALHEHALAGLEAQRIGDFHMLARAHMAHLHTFFIATRTDAQKRDAVAMARVHVRLNLEHKAGERGLGGGDAALLRRPALRRRRPIHEVVEHLAHAEVGQRGAEKYRRKTSGAKGTNLEGVAGPAHQFNVLQEVLVFIAEQSPGGVAGQTGNPRIGRAHRVMPALEAVNRIGVEVVDPAKFIPHADGPVNGRGGEFQNLFDLIEQFDRIAYGAIHLVHKADDRRVAQAADIHQLDGAILDALGAVDNHQRGIHRGQGAVGVFREVLVPGGVEQVYQPPPIGKLHYRGRHRDTPLLLQAHPVGSGVRTSLAFNTPGDRDGVA